MPLSDSAVNRPMIDPEASVMWIGALPSLALAQLLAPFGLQCATVADDAAIPGSYWGDREAGLIGNRLYLRRDTPVHSALHEAGHFICMDAERRNTLHTDAGGTDTEENAVCYLQVLLAERLSGYSRERVFADMDAWGYHFILGSARAWFERDADDAIRWLQTRGLITAPAPAAVGDQQSAACGADLPTLVIGAAE